MNTYSQQNNFASVISVVRFSNFGIGFTFLNYGSCKKMTSVPCRFLGLESVSVYSDSFETITRSDSAIW